MPHRDAIQRLRHPARRRGLDLQDVLRRQPRPQPGLPLLLRGADPPDPRTEVREAQDRQVKQAE